MRTALFNPNFSPVIFKVILLINFVVGIPFWILLLTGYHSSIFPRIELSFYITVVVLFGLVLILLQKFIIISVRKNLLKYFMLMTIVTSVILGFVLWQYRIELSPEAYPTDCDIPSPSGQKIYHAKNIEPSSSFMEIWIYNNQWPFVGKVLGYGFSGYIGNGADFCAAKWIDDDSLFMPDIFTSPHKPDLVSHKINYFEIDWFALIWFFVCFSLVFVGLEALKLARKVRWL